MRSVSAGGKKVSDWKTNNPSNSKPPLLIYKDQLGRCSLVTQYYSLIAGGERWAAGAQALGEPVEKWAEQGDGEREGEG